MQFTEYFIHRILIVYIIIHVFFHNSFLHELNSTKLIGKSRFAFLDYLRSRITKKGKSLISLDMVMMDEEVYFSVKQIISKG